MPQLALAAVGAAIGGGIGGAFLGIGAATWGWMAGSMLGSALFAPKNKATLADMRVPKLHMGSKMHRVYGTVRVPLSLRWQSEWRATENSAGGKGGGGSEFYTYACDTLYWISDIAGMPDNLCPEGIMRVWWNGELVWSAHPDADEDTVDASQDTDKWSAMTFYPGDATQLPWPVYEAALGAENADAHRGVACVAFENLQTGTWTTLPVIEVEVTTVEVPPLPMFVSAAGGENGQTLPNAADVQVGDAIVVFVNHYGAGADLTPPAGYTEFQSFSDSAAITRTHVIGRIADGTATDDAIACEIESGLPGAFVSVILRGMVAEDFPSYLELTSVSGVNGLNPAAVNAPPTTGPWMNLVCGYVWSGNTHLGETINITAAPTGYTTAAETEYIANLNENVHMVVAYSESSDTNEDPFPFTSETGNSSISEGSILVRIPMNGGVELEYPDLADIVSAECLRSGLTAGDIDVSELVGIPVRGFVAQGSAREAIEDLMSVFYFYAVCSDKLYFRLLDAASVATIQNEDTGAGVDQPGESFAGLERGNDLEVPSEVTVVSPNPSADYDPGAETSDRLVTAGRRKESVNSLVVLTPEERKGRANAIAMDARTGMHTASLSFDDTYAQLEPGDVVAVYDEEGNAYTVRMSRETYAQGVHSTEIRLFNRSDLVQTGTTSDTYTPVIDIAPVADTEMVLLDTGLLRDEDDGAHLLAAVKPAEDGRWSQASIYRSPDNSTFAPVASTGNESVIGEASTALCAFTGWTWDEWSTVTVDVGDGELTSSSSSAMQADQTINVAALGVDGRWEILRYRTATLVSAGVYTLSGLLRGLRGTESNRGNHQVGDTFVKLSSSSQVRVSLSNAELGLTRYWKGVTAGQQVSSVASQTLSPDGVALKPWAPTRFRVARDGSNDCTLSWMRRTRLQVRHGGTGGSYVPLGETTESYEVDVYADGTYTTVVRTLTSASETAAYTAAQQTSDGLTPGNTLYVRVYQLSALVGRGYPLEASA